MSSPVVVWAWQYDIIMDYTVYNIVSGKFFVGFYFFYGKPQNEILTHRKFPAIR